MIFLRRGLNGVWPNPGRVAGASPLRGFRLSRALLVMAGALGMLWVTGCRPGHVTGVKVEVTNRMTNEVRALRVTCRGDAAEIGRLGPGESASVRLRPSGETSVSFAGALSGSPSLRTNVDVYLEAGYGGRLRIEIRPDGLVRWKDETGLGLGY